MVFEEVRESDYFYGVNNLNYLEAMDLGQIIYIVAIVAYFLYRSVSKKKGGQPEASEDPEANPPQKGLSFEDLLREIREAQVPKLPEEVPKRKPNLQPIPVTSVTSEERNYPKPFSEQMEEGEGESTFYAGSYEGNKKNPYLDLANRTFVEPESIKFNSYQAQVPYINPYAALLKNPKSFREAIVVSEILRPKYF
jgi:hypothetical protein